MSSNRIIISTIIGLFTFCWCLQVNAEPRYSITDLGVLGGNTSYAYAVNNNTQVVGESFNKAFLWENNHMIDLQTWSSFPPNSSRANAINNGGQAVGTFYVAGFTPIGYMFENGLATPVFASNSYAYDINNQSKVIGLENGQAVLKDMRTGTVTAVSGGFTPTALNDLDHIVGGRVFWNAGNITLLGNLGLDLATSTHALDINNSDVVVGYSYTAPGVQHAFKWDTGNGISDLGTLGGNISGAFGINEAGVVVGWSQNDAGLIEAAMWDSSGQIYDLNLLVDNLVDWTRLSEAHAINDNGEIVGYGVTVNGDKHAFLLSPLAITGETVPMLPIWAMVLLATLLWLLFFAARKSPSPNN